MKKLMDMRTNPLSHKTDLVTRFKSMKEDGNPIAIYNKRQDLFSELKFKKLGTTFKLLYLPKSMKEQKIKKICYIMSGYFPNIENIKFLVQLLQNQDGEIDIIFRQNTLEENTKKREQQIQKVISYQKIHFKYHHGLTPLKHPNAKGYDLVSIPYTKYSMFESDNMNIEAIQAFTKENETPLLIF